MSSIKSVKVRAKVSIGGLVVKTPYVKSFNVTKTRGQISTFDVSLMVSHDEISGTITGDWVIIEAGVDSSLKKIFQGMARRAKIAPCWEDPKYVILSVSGEDVLSQLRGKKFSRRCRSELACWTVINSVVREGLKSDKFLFQNHAFMTLDGGKAFRDSQLINYAGAGGDNGNLRYANAPSGSSGGGVSFSISSADTSTGGS